MKCYFCREIVPLDDCAVNGCCLMCFEYHTDTGLRMPKKLRLLIEQFLMTLNMSEIMR